MRHNLIAFVFLLVSFFSLNNDSKACVVFGKLSSHKKKFPRKPFSLNFPQINLNLIKNGSSFGNGAVAIFDSTFLKAVDTGNEDSGAFPSFGESITLWESATDLSIDGLPIPQPGDTIQIHLTNMNASTNYQLSINATSYSCSTNVYLYDKYTQLVKKLKVDTNYYSFTTNSNVSVDEFRFALVFNTGSVKLTGKVVSPLGVAIPNVTVSNNTNNSSITSQIVTGSYSFQLNAGVNCIVKPSKKNDIYKSNGVSTIDIALAQSHILKKSILNSPYKLIAADVDNSGTINTIDIVYMKRLILQIDTIFPSKKLWSFVDSSYFVSHPSVTLPLKDSISYSSINANYSNQTFIGIKMGDLNYDWNPAVQRTIHSNTPIEFYYDNIYLNDENTFKIPIKVKNLNNIIGMQFTLSFNNSLMQFVGLNSNLLKMDFSKKNADKGLITFLWNEPNNNSQTIKDETVLMELVFSKTGIIQKEDIEINSSITPIEAWDENYQMKTIVKTNGVIMQKAKMVVSEYNQKEKWEVVPNPSNGLVALQLKLNKSKTLQFALTNNSGKVVYQTLVHADAGLSNVKLDLNSQSHLNTGIYFLKTAGIEGETVKTIVIK